MRDVGSTVAAHCCPRHWDMNSGKRTSEPCSGYTVTEHTRDNSSIHAQSVGQVRGLECGDCAGESDIPEDSSEGRYPASE